MHDDNCFITLTYDDENLPEGGSLRQSDFVKFMKRLRKKVPRVRVYYCGEYGETTFRPHYHACLFGWRPADPTLFSTSGEFPLYESPMLAKTWGHGHASFGEMTFETAAYTARYVTKKITGPGADDHYTRMDPETGEIHHIDPEFCGMSRRPGIGLPWLQKYGRDAYDKDEVILRGRSMRPPRAYDKAFENLDYPKMEEIKLARSQRSLERKTIPERQLWNGRKIACQKLKQREMK